MFQHIKAFADMMKRKGYDGHFQSSHGYNDKLFENMIQHVLQSYHEKSAIGPLNLLTYTHWKDEDSPYVRCNFYTDFNDNEGFKVQKLDVEYGNEYGPIRSKEIAITANREIPDRDQLNSMMLKRKKNLRL